MKVEDAMSLISTAIKAAVSQVLAPIVQPPPCPRHNGKTNDDEENDENDENDGLLCASDCNGASLNEGLMAAMKEMVAKEVHTYMATCSLPFHGYPSPHINNQALTLNHMRHLHLNPKRRYIMLINGYEQSHHQQQLHHHHYSQLQQ